MQETRQQILEILFEKKQATVDDIVEGLFHKRGSEITAVTVRHHLNLLQRDGLITDPELLHRNVPGRPQYVYALSEKGLNRFPNNYKNLAQALLHRLESTLSEDHINVIMEGVADDLAKSIHLDEKTLEHRIDAAIVYLNEHGYDAKIVTGEGGYYIKTQTCPYNHITTGSQNLCNMDLRLISSIIGIVPRMLSRISDGDDQCTYFIPKPE